VSVETVTPSLSAVDPLRVIEGGRLWLRGRDLPVPAAHEDLCTIGGAPARAVFAATTRMAVEVPSGLEGGRTEVKVPWLPGATLFVAIGAPLATGFHHVDSPAVDAEGRVYVTYSGARGQQAPVSIFRIAPGGPREPFVTGIVNATSMVFGPDGRLYVSSRFDGHISRIFEDGTHEVRGKSTTLVTLPASVAAYHLALGPDDHLYVTGPTLASYDRVYRVSLTGQVETIDASFGRPQGLAFDRSGTLHVVEALAGSSGVYALPAHGAKQLVVSGPRLVGVAFAPDDRMIVVSNDTVYAFA
jgi:sugar lactone lactonase YvrE